MVLDMETQSNFNAHSIENEKYGMTKVMCGHILWYTVNRTTWENKFGLYAFQD